MTTINVRILDERMRRNLPAYATPSSAGMDLRACIDGALIITPGRAHLVPTGIAIHIGDPGLAAVVLPLIPLCSITASCLFLGLTHALVGGTH